MDGMAALFERLGIESAHVASQFQPDLDTLIDQAPQRFTTLTLMAPNRTDATRLARLGERLLIFTGDQGYFAETTERAIAALPAARAHRLADARCEAWTDVVGERREEVLAALLDHIAGGDASVLARDGESGEVDGITYRIQGRGPALILMPMLLSPGQWDGIVEDLAADHSVILTGGDRLGMVAVLEGRGTDGGYRRVLRSLMEEVALASEERLLEVGCGTGAVARWLAATYPTTAPITAVDVNDFLLGEARTFAARDGLAEKIDFGPGDATALPFEDGWFDVTLCLTVMEEGDADAMLAELIRVTRPGGRIGAIVRAVDRPMIWNLDIPDDMRERVEAPIRSVNADGCADASLYDRFAAAGLRNGRYFAALMSVDDTANPTFRYYLPHVLSLLGEAEKVVWHDAFARAEAAGTLHFARPMHCAVGIKPEE